MIGVQGFRASWAIDQHFKNLTYTAASLSLLINYPHFLISYKLAYRRGTDFVLSHAWQLLIVPFMLVAVFAIAFFAYERPVGTLPLVPTVIGALDRGAASGRCSPGRGLAICCSRPSSIS